MKLKVLIIVILLSVNCNNYSVNKEVSNLQFPTKAQTQTLDNSSNLEGVYEFISETNNVSFPEQKTEKRTSEEWKGFWFFQNGMFSKTMMKIDRPEWTPSRFPPNAQETGFDGASGNYQIDNGQIKIDYHLAFYPGKIFEVESLSYTLEKDVLTLTRNLGRSRENNSEGNQIIVLKKLR